MTQPASPFRYFNSSPEVIRLVVMMYVKYPLSLRNVEDLLHERDWGQERIEEYVEWAGRVVDACRSADPWLAGQFDASANALRSLEDAR
jgi:transposase-like protein